MKVDTSNQMTCRHARYISVNARTGIDYHRKYTGMIIVIPPNQEQRDWILRLNRRLNGDECYCPMCCPDTTGE